MQITVHSGSHTYIIEGKQGETLLQTLQRNQLAPAAPCGGNGTCGKCKVFLPSGEGVLACQTVPDADMEIRLPSAGQAAIETGGKQHTTLNPAVSKVCKTLPEATLENPIDDGENLAQALGLKEVPLPVLAALPKVLREKEHTVTATFYKRQLLWVEPGDTTGQLYGAAIDIGTTTVVCYIVDLITGEIVHTCAELNRQKAFGADVISRIKYASEQDADILHKTIVEQLNRMLQSFSQHASIYQIVIAGNTTMLHFLCGVDAANLAVSPFTAGFLAKQTIPAVQLGLTPSYATVELFPSASAYVGGDITAAAAATSMKNPSLLIDIGTNGEIVLKHQNRYYCCATAAGPAFEGGNIACGMAGVAGAVCHVDEDLQFQTIQDAPAAGLCGSGLIDFVAALLEREEIDETGFLEDTVYLSDKAYLTAKDVRELQLAKSAILSGIECLLKEAGLSAKDIAQVYLAGGFGSKMDIHNACKIGLIPAELEKKTVAVGNAAGMGAIAALKNKSVFQKATNILRNTQYVELSSDPYFQERYVENMFF